MLDDATDQKKIVDFLHLKPFSDYGLPLQIVKQFGGKEQYLYAIQELENQIYQ